MTYAPHRKEGLFGLTVPEGQGPITCKVGKHGSRQAWWPEQQAECSHLKQQAQGRESKLKMVQAFHLSKPVSSDILSPTSPKPPQTKPPNGDGAFQMPETMEGWFSSKPSQLQFL